MIRRPAADLARTTFGVLFIGLMLAACLWILRPFVGPGLWAAMIVVATWPMMRRVQGLLWQRRSLAVAAMSLLLLLLFVVPLTLAVLTIVGNADRLLEWARQMSDYHLPELPPAWLTQLPLLGGLVERSWEQATLLGLRDLWPKLTPYAGSLTRWFVGQVGGVGFMLLQGLVTVLIASVMYATGEDAAALVRRFALRLGGERGAEVVDLAGGAIRGVALGVGGTAAAQALISGLGLLLAGVPFAGLLTALMFMLCIAQIGPLLVLVPAVAWLFWSGSVGWGIALAVVAVLVTTLDNVLRPLLIRMGANLPLLLIFCGVIGGLLSMGLVGIFVGPLVLAVAWRLLDAWLADGEVAPPDYRD